MRLYMRVDSPSIPWCITCADPEGGDRGPDPPGKIQKYRVPYTGPDTLKITRLPIHHSMLGHHRPASETPFKWRFAGGPLMAH